MYLARAFLNPLSRAVRADLADAHGLHRTVMRAFPDDAGPNARRELGVLFRVDEDARRGRYLLLLQSAERPDFTRLPVGYFLDIGDDFELVGASTDNPALRDVTEERAGIAPGQRFAFRLRANTTRKIDTKTGPDGAHRNGRRVPVRGDEGRIEWLVGRAAASGFAVDASALRVTEVPPAGGRSQKAITLAGALFEGILEVRDAERFRAALESGIGPAKAFGFGLLSIAPLR